MEPDALTAWIPIGDISPVGGGLMYLEDSVPLGQEIETGFYHLNRDLPEEDQLDAFNVNVSGCSARFPPDHGPPDAPRRRSYTRLQHVCDTD